MRALASAVFGQMLDATLLTGFPRTVRIETTNGCNARCTICPHPQMERPIQRMPDALFEKVVRECAEHRVHAIHLHNFGEPLLDKKLPDKIAYCKQLGIRRVKIFSNGSLMTEERARALIASGLDQIKISFDGANKEEFERIRHPLKYDVVVSNIVRLAKLRDEIGGKLRIEVACSTTSDRDETMAALERHVDKFNFTRIHNWADWEGDAVEMAWAGPGGRTRQRKPCARTWQTFTVLSNGQVSLCCLDYEGQTILGDLSQPDETIASIWRNEAYARVRRLHRTGQQNELELCRDCTKSFW